MDLIKASIQQKTVIQNLMQFYMYDFSEYVELDVESNGLFAPYKDLDNYWNDVNRFPYIIKQDERYIGFSLIRYIETTQSNYFSIAEFFVMRKYRKNGIGRSFAHMLFNLHKGYWEVFQKETNKPAQAFWRKVIAEYRNNNFTERSEQGRIIQNFHS